MSYDYSENVLVQGAAGDLLRDELGWEVQFAYNTEVLGEQGTFGRKSYNDILLTRYLYSALKKLNPWLTDAQCLEAEKQLRHYSPTRSALMRKSICGTIFLPPRCCKSTRKNTTLSATGSRLPSSIKTAKPKRAAPRLSTSSIPKTITSSR